MPDDPSLEPSLGDAVRAAREAAGMTVFQVSGRTRIRSEILQDLEQGRTASSGGAVYARGHLKAIAAATGADPAVLLAAHDRATGAVAPPAPAAPAPPPARPALSRRLPAAPAPPAEPVAHGSVPVSSLRLPSTAVRERGGGPRWGLAALATCAVLVVLFVVGSLSGSRTPDPGAGQALQGPAGSTATPPATTPPATVGPSAVASIPAPTGATLRLRVKGDRSWVNVTGGRGKNLYRGVLEQGAVKDFTDPASLTVTVGNAGAVSLICGGKDARAGSAGQVRTFTCKRSGLVPA